MTRSPVCFARAMPLSSGRSALLPMTEASPVPRRPRPLLTLSILLLGICFAAAACGPPGDPSPDPPSNADSPDTGTPDAGTPDADSPDADSPDADSPDADSPDTGPDTGPEPTIESCDDGHTHTLCATNSACTWLGTATGCVDSDTVTDQSSPTPISIRGMHLGEAFIAGHAALPTGAYHAFLGLWEYDDTLGGSLLLKPDDVDAPEHAYRLEGSLNPQGVLSLELTDARCTAGASDHPETCQALAEHSHLRFSTTGTFQSGTLQDLAPFSRAIPLDADPEQSLPFTPMIGMVQEPHGGFKPLEVPPSGDNRQSLQGTWLGEVQFLHAPVAQDRLRCEARFGSGDDSAAVQEFSCTDPYGASTALPVLGDAQIARGAPNDETLYTSFVVANLRFDLILWHGLILQGIITGPALAPATEARHPSEVPPSEILGVVVLDADTAVYEAVLD